ncbi:MAG: twin-arginine translocase TatA/TatE family subunit [bacterium]|nr:twin-arginine translocase TatA/TatE family subunit [bacterium]
MAPLAIGLGMQELVILLLIVVFLFGARRIPEIARGLGEGIRGFRTSLKGDEEPTKSENNDATEP